MPTVTVHGMGSAPATPDHVEMILIVTAREAAPDAALDHMAERDATLRLILDELGVPEAARTTTGATVNERSEDDRETGHETSVGYQAAVALTVKLEAPDSAGRLMREATSRAGAQVRGPIWRAADDHPARLDACRAAARDAKRRAEAYAAAMGLRLGPLITMTEAITQVSYGHVLSMSRASAAAENLGVSPGEQSVSATVEATFDLLGAQLGDS